MDGKMKSDDKDIFQLAFALLLLALVTALLLASGCVSYQNEGTSVVVWALGNRQISVTPSGAVVTVTSSPETIEAIGQGVVKGLKGVP